MLNQRGQNNHVVCDKQTRQRRVNDLQNEESGFLEHLLLELVGLIGFEADHFRRFTLDCLLRLLFVLFGAASLRAGLGTASLLALAIRGLFGAGL